MTKLVLVLDIDATLADFTHREHLLRSYCVSCAAAGSGYCNYCGYDVFQTPLASWKAFTDPSLLSQDGVVPYAQEAIKQFQKFGADTHFITGRRQQARAVTQEWLTKHFGFDSTKNRLLMRESYNYDDTNARDVPASVHKERTFQKLLEICGYSGNELFYFFDDDVNVLPVYSKYGVAFKAPECWGTIVHKSPVVAESLFAK